MGFTNITFTTGQKMSSTILNQVDQNFDALAEGDPSAPRVARPSVWVHTCGFSNNEGGIYASRGITSFTRNAIGAYTIVFDTFFNDANKVGVNMGFVDNVALSGDGFLRMANVNTLTTSDCTFRDRKSSTSSSAEDDNEGMLVTFWEIP
jgi:hypothetical protein|tara:strand:+ start:228 stop:674 length:447 start_codon:yes stop_codon:yes gene_type:complete